MLAGLDPLVILYMPCDSTQDDLLHQLPQHRGLLDKHKTRMPPLTVKSLEGKEKGERRQSYRREKEWIAWSWEVENSFDNQDLKCLGRAEGQPRPLSFHGEGTVYSASASLYHSEYDTDSSPAKWNKPRVTLFQPCVLLCLKLSPDEVTTSTSPTHQKINGTEEVLFKVKQLFKNTTQRSALRLDSYEWQVREETPTKKGKEEEVDEVGYSEAGPSREEEKEEAELINEMVTTQSLSLSELRDMRKDFSCHPGEHVVTWLL
ncbi:hypothetical protein QYF61_000524 [Mycteria americana]|uniref:Uncharacterized protein n=1 Tax=Mycteria americana TaxID=33587 RepID=A0AAN7PFI5_MYCAM|nr:hypothetical protein QYF61_000524 [Mycteria americana]